VLSVCGVLIVVGGLLRFIDVIAYVYWWLLDVIVSVR